MPNMKPLTNWPTNIFLLASLVPALPANGQETDPNATAAHHAVWPGKEWQTASPHSQGLSASALDAAQDYAQQAGGGSGCIIRHGYLVKEWGDPERLAEIKSATKGAVGTTLFGLAVDAGLVRLDDSAAKHYPAIGGETPDNRRDWLAEITVRHLATMTAGFDDGRPPQLIYRPGTGGFYANDGSNMLAELLTLRFNEDLAAVLEREVMDPIGVARSQWNWRTNAYRDQTIAGITSREIASGITITHRALARIGYLYLRQGVWRDNRILSREFIHEATQPTDLPSFVPDYGFFWGTNGRATHAAIPNDAYWALGLGDSFVLVCPSLDIVAVRLGVGSGQSQLPGGDQPHEWGQRVAGFFRLVVAAVQSNGEAGPPYPPSPIIKNVSWAPAESIARQAIGGDNRPLTWADDGHLYTAYGDGSGFEPLIPDKLSLGFVRIEGGPDDFTGFNIRSSSGEQRGHGSTGKKASGLLCIDGVLYMWVRNASNSQLAWSHDHGTTWQWSEWKFTSSFGCPTFLNFGQNYAGARDDYVYIYSHDNESAYRTADQMVLARAPQARIKDRDAYRFFNCLDSENHPTWTADIAQRGTVFTHAGNCYRSGISYNAGLKRYLWCQILPGDDTRFDGGFGIYDAPEPWGPWSTAYFTANWDVGPGEASSFPPKWMSALGKTLHLVFSGDDCFAVRKAELEVSQW